MTGWAVCTSSGNMSDNVSFTVQGATALAAGTAVAAAALLL